MDFNDWKKLHLKDVTLQTEFFELAGGVQATVEHAQITIDRVFDALLAKCRQHHYTYFAVGGVREFLVNQRMSCMSATEIFIGLVLRLTDTILTSDDQITTTYDVPILCRPGDHAPVAIGCNIQGADNYLLFSGGHTIAWLFGTQYDVLNGIRAANVPLHHGSFVSKEPMVITVDFNDTTYHFDRVGETADQLSEFTVNPALPA